MAHTHPRSPVRALAPLLLLLAATATPAAAQITYEGCVDAAHRPVASIRNDQLPDVAMATLVNGQPVIIYNAVVLSWQAPQTRLFWYGHECGHHALGHVLNNIRMGEQEADCFGIIEPVRRGLLGPQDVAVIQNDIAQIGPGDWEHLPGPVRAINLRACLAWAGLLTPTGWAAPGGYDPSWLLKPPPDGLGQLPEGSALPLEEPSTRLEESALLGDACVACIWRFEDFPATATFEGEPAAPELASAPYGRMFRTVLGRGAAEGPNFAGRYTVVSWGCGTGCQITAVVDAETGRLSRQTLLTVQGVDYRADSELLIADPPDPELPLGAECLSCGVKAYYRWTGERFEPLGQGPHPHLKGERPWGGEG